jgi:plastocyanin
MAKLAGLFATACLLIAPALFAQNADVTVQIQVNADGTIDCAPNEVHVRRGQTIQWQNPADVTHTGTFRGKVRGPKQSGFTKDELKQMTAPGALDSAIPSATRNWSNGQLVRIRTDAPAGAYKYDLRVTVRGRPPVVVDPIVIIDE